MREFEWDVHNVGHVAQHDVTPAEVEDAFERPHVIAPAKAVRGEERWKLFGSTRGGRYLIVVYAARSHKLRPVTAYTMNQKDRRNYATQIDQESGS